MNMEQVIKHYGGKVNAAAAFGRSTQCLDNWESKGIPIFAQHAISSISGGVLKVDRQKKVAK